MLKIITTLAIALISTLANAQVTESRTVANFTKIEVTDAVILHFTSGAQEITINALDRNRLSNFSTKVDNGTLKISCRQNIFEPITVYISSNHVTAMEASKNAQIILKNEWSSPTISVRIASGASFKGSIKADKTILAAKSGAIFNTRVETTQLEGSFVSGAKVNLSGSAAIADIKTDGDALYSAKNLITEVIKVTCKGISRAVVYAKKDIKAKTEDTATITYFGTPVKVALGENNLSHVVYPKK